MVQLSYLIHFMDSFKFIIRQQQVILSMRTQTEVTLHLQTLTVTQNLAIDPQGFIIKIFMSCSRVDTRVFKIHSNIMRLNEKLKIRNICAKELEFWLCNTQNKILAVASLDLEKNDGAFSVDLKMLQTEFGRLEGSLQLKVQEIQKEVYIQPDQQLLKKVQDPLEIKRKQQQQQRRAKQAAEALQAAKNIKKPAVTLTRFNKKDQPFI